MPHRRLVAHPPRSTPPDVHTTGAQRRTLPPDLLRDASRRLGALALLAATLWIVAPGLDHLTARLMGAGSAWADFRVPDAIAAVSALVSLGLYVYTRRGTRDPARVLDLGLAYMVVTALALGLLMHWYGPPPGMPLFPMITWIGAVILMFAAIVPNDPVRMLVAGLVAASMNPLGMLLRSGQHGWARFTVGDALLMHYPDYLLVGVAVVIAGVVTRLGQQVTRARELGSYELGELLGSGGMGEVYRATHRMLARPAAIKLIRGDSLAGKSLQAADVAVKRFHREAEAAASLRSPHTVEVYDFGVSEDGTLYSVMELLDGMDLETMVREHGPLPPGRTIHLLRQVCESLEEAHARGLVHRDIKPANIFVTRLGLRHDFVKVLDFGIVKAIDGRERGETLATLAGQTVGTPAYMAPELALGEAVDGRADVYALGCVAYFVLTGELVFRAENAMQVVARHLTFPPEAPSSRTGAAVPPDLERLVMACLAKKPEDRPTAATLGRELARLDPQSWSEDDAARWWAVHQATAPAGRSAEGAGTHVVDDVRSPSIVLRAPEPELLRPPGRL